MFQFSNRARTILARNITIGDTTLTVASGTGAEFPNPSGPGDAVALTLVSASDSRQYEVVYCVQRNGDSFTVWRGQEGTTPLSFQSGDLVSLNMTAALYRRMAQAGYLGQFSQEVAQSPSAYQKGAIVCDETDAAIYWVSLQDQNSTTPDEHNSTWLKLDFPSFQKAMLKAKYDEGQPLPSTILGTTLDDVDDGFFDREQARLLTALEAQQSYAQTTQQTARAEQKIRLALQKSGVPS